MKKNSEKKYFFQLKTSNKIIVGQDGLYDTLYPIRTNNIKNKQN